MGYGNPNQFPVFLKAQADGSVTAEVRRFEDFLTSSAQNIGRAFGKAAEQADAGFDFSQTRRAIAGIESEITRLGKLQIQRSSDPLGIGASLGSLKNTPVQRGLDQQRASEAALDAQRQRAHAERMTAIQQEFDAAMTAVRARRDAESAAIADIIAKEDSLVALEQQRVANQARLVAGRTFIQAPAFDPTGSAQSAAAAQQHANALNVLALAAEKVAGAESAATATDRAYAATVRASATAAQEEASRLSELAATQTRVAGAVRGLNKDQLSLQSSQRASRFATLQASQQFQDFFIQIGSGQNAMVAFSQQASQLAFVMSMAGGTAGKFARFMAGGGGTIAFALLAIIPLVGALIGKLTDQNGALDDAVEKMKKEADQAQLNAKAYDIWKNSIEGVIDAVRRQKEELDRLLKSEAAAQINAVTQAQNNVQRLQKELSDATKAFADLGGDAKITVLQKSITTVRASSAGEPGAAAASTALLEGELKKLQDAKGRIDEAQTAFDSAAKNLTNSQIVLGRAQGAAIADLSKQATRWQDLYSDALKGIVQNNPTYSPRSGDLSAVVERVAQAMQHAAAQKTPFGDFAAQAKQLGHQLDLGKLTVDQYVSAMDKLASSLEAVAKAAEEAKKGTKTSLSDFQLPVQGRITSNFGSREAPKEGASTYHKGIDIAVPVGTPVKAPQVGTVESVGFDPKLGKFVIISHGGGTTTRYGHLSTVSVKKGDELQQGDVFAQSGATGNVTGPHLHYGVYQGGKPVDPLKGQFPADEFKVAESSQRAAEAAQRAAEALALAAARTLDDVTRALEHPKGLIEAGNIDIFNRPTHKNADGSISTVRSASFGTDKGEVLLPTISPTGQALSNQQAVAEYQKSGKHLGIFDNADDATAYAELLHRQQEVLYESLGKLSDKGKEAFGAQILQQTQKLGDESASAAEKVQRINEQWNTAPKLIDQAAQAHRELDSAITDAVSQQNQYNLLIAELKQAKPPGWEEQVGQLEKSRDALGGIIAAAKAAGPVIDDGLLKPLREYGKQAEQQKAIDEALLAGDQDRANALRTIADLEEKIGPLTAQQKQDVLDTVAAERKRSFELQRQDQLISRVARSAGVVQDSLTGGIEAFLKNPTDIKGILAPFKAIFADFRQNFARSISEALLGGDLSSNIEQALRAKSDPLGAAGSDLTGAAGDLTSAASDLTSAASTLASSGSGGGAPSPGQIASTPTAYLPGALLSSGIGGGGYLSLFGQIAGNTNTAATASTNAVSIQQHQADMLHRSALLSNPEQYYNLIGANVGQSIDKFFGGGKFFEGIGSKLGTVMQGVQYGQMSGQLVGLLGKRFQGNASNIGSSLGGGLGMLVGGPVGALIGGLLGAVAGGLLGGKKKESRGNVTASSDEYGNFSVGKYKGDDTPTRKQGSIQALNSIFDSLESLAQQLGTVIDASKGSVSIGIQGDDYRVDTKGLGRTNKNSPGVLNFGSDEQGAVEAAMKNLIEDGVLGPIRDGTKKLLLNGRSMSSAIAKAIKFEDVFKELKRYTDPVGAAIDELDQQFNELRRIFAEAGASTAEYSQLEQLYAFKRADAIKEATQAVNSTLQDLLKDLTYRGDTGLSLRTRQQRALAELSPYQQQIGMGQQVDQEGFANVVQSLLDIERQMYGSTKPYFDMLSTLTQLTQKAISNTGQPAQVPGVTPAPSSVPTGTPTTVYTGSPSSTGTTGGTVATPAVPASVAAANDNYSMAVQIVAAINKQTTDLIAGGLKVEDITRAITTALGSGAGGYGAGGPIGVPTGGAATFATLTAAINSGNTALQRHVLDLLEAQKNNNAILERGLPMAGTNGIRYGSDNWWEQAGAGMYFSQSSF